SCEIAVFFFQAEDGIRDFHVTGVQTCALPILLLATAGLIAATLPATGLRLISLPMLAGAIWSIQSRTMPDMLVSEDATLVAVRRSEERRVGKECRARGAADL